MKHNKIDWNDVWKELYNENLHCRGSDECASIWESRERARDFLNRSLDNPERILNIITTLPVESGTRVLDIGAGPGTLAVPLAGVAAHVTAVEPADGMAEVMTEYAEKEGLTNLSVVRKRWEDLDPAVDLDGRFDVVVASYSLGMPDIRAAIEAMCKVSSRWVYLYWFAGTTTWEQAQIDLWPALHGTEYRQGPKADVLFNVLYSMGICPNVQTSRMAHTRTFPDLDTAVAEFRAQYRVETPAQERVLRDYLARTLTTNGGTLLHSGMTTRVKFWWEVNRCQ
ncbi:ubiquinone/menaquinone biosynthesis C-methylase UbiE [Methanofollis sp. W23]|uniref:class I SAM-dependent methyltransferase n=1 Tax=Methanofollis sp. W23 TaxID=2817849 RepID=UPI001AE6456B|nr:class I SAM-dependent methyltransferase [Methanofollis sp. W23]MBP2144938.1 ubiquinone/menaquinone biosynthesis C-methylase UbiE [Methanofollis sp. W23]